VGDARVSEPQTHRADLETLLAGATSELKEAGPEEVLAWALSTFPRDRIALCTSLQDEGMAILDMAWRIDPKIRVFTIDTGRLPAATLDLMEEVRGRYGIKLEVLFPDADEVSSMVTEHGINLFYESPELRLSCCGVRKANPLNRRLATLDAWITGLRRDQDLARESTREIELDQEHGGIAKINPLADWTRAQVLDYIREHDVPRNALYSQGYTSIGCDPCTRAIEPGEDLRAGRWWWETGDKECGIHYEMTVNERGETVAVSMRGKADG
jgi:thioredoxin-dependent adenylylsulfate APS reductase